jgi:leucyl-tRNA synthetase
LDTLFGLTYVVVSPEHPILKTIVREDCQKEVFEYIKKASQKSDLEKQLNEKDKTGVFTGSYAINPANFEKVPI